MNNPPETPAPERIYHVSHGQLSVARHYGGCRVFGAYYHYDDESDTLIRHDVYHAEIRAGKIKAREQSDSMRKAFQQAQNMFDGF